MIPKANQTIRELAVLMPDAIPVFAQYHIDYCCSGNKSLTDACADVGANVDDVIHSLQGPGQAGIPRAQPVPDFQTLTMSDLLRYITGTHHSFARQQIARIRELFEKVCDKHGAFRPELYNLRHLFRSLCDDIEPHLRKEERVLFPYLKELEEVAQGRRKFVAPRFGTIRNPVRLMATEHEADRQLLCIIRKVTGNYTPPADSDTDFRTLYQTLAELDHDLSQHMHLENHVLFPRAMQLEEIALMTLAAHN